MREAGPEGKESRIDLPPELGSLQREVIACERCPRLRRWCREVAEKKRRVYQDWEYWGKPVPGFGDPEAQLLIIGLAPAAHGANRTGRMFTGDESGNWLYRALYETGFANRPTAQARDDGLILRNCYITAALRCAPPQNKPRAAELHNCRPYLVRELELLERVRVILALGRIGFEAALHALQGRGYALPSPKSPFGHNVLHDLGEGLPLLLCSYHPSRQNTQTGRLTWNMFNGVFERAREIIGR